MNEKYVWKSSKELEILLKERGLEVDIPNFFENINYSHIIYNYGKYFLDDLEGKTFIKGAKLSHVFNLYKLNSKLSSVLFEFFNDWESKLKSSIANTMSKEYPIGYLDTNWYSPRNPKRNSEFVIKMEKENKKFVPYYIKEKLINDRIPLWLMVDNLSIGDLRNLVSISNNNYKKTINKQMNINNMKLYGNINKYRNRVFHFNSISPKISWFVWDDDKKVFLTNENGDKKEFSTTASKLFYYMKNRFYNRAHYKKLLKTFAFFNLDIGLDKKEIIKLYDSQDLKLFEDYERFIEDL